MLRHTLRVHEGSELLLDLSRRKCVTRASRVQIHFFVAFDSMPFLEGATELPQQHSTGASEKTKKELQHTLEAVNSVSLSLLKVVEA